MSVNTLPIGKMYRNNKTFRIKCGNCNHDFEVKRGNYRCPKCQWNPPHKELEDTLKA